MVQKEILCLLNKRSLFPRFPATINCFLFLFLATQDSSCWWNFICLFILCVHTWGVTHVCRFHAPVYVLRGQRRALSILHCHALPCSSEGRSLPEPGACMVFAFASPHDFSVSTASIARATGVHEITSGSYVSLNSCLLVVCQMFLAMESSFQS